MNHISSCSCMTLEAGELQGQVTAKCIKIRESQDVSSCALLQLKSCDMVPPPHLDFKVWNFSPFPSEGGNPGCEHNTRECFSSVFSLFQIHLQHVMHGTQRQARLLLLKTNTK